MGEGDEDDEGEGEEGKVDDKGGAGVQADELVESVRDFGDDWSWRNVSGSSCGGLKCTPPKIPISTAPPAMSTVPATKCTENSSPRMMRAKNALYLRSKHQLQLEVSCPSQAHNRLTAPKGPSTTIGRAPIWKIVPRRFEQMKMANPPSHNGRR